MFKFFRKKQHPAFGPYVLHVGLTPTDADLLQDLAGKRCRVDGDAWLAWGERPGPGSSDTLHVQLAVTGQRELDQIFAIFALMGISLGEITIECDEGPVIGVVTPVNDWSDRVSHLH